MWADLTLCSVTQQQKVRLAQCLLILHGPGGWWVKQCLLKGDHSKISTRQQAAKLTHVHAAALEVLWQRPPRVQSQMLLHCCAEGAYHSRTTEHVQQLQAVCECRDDAQPGSATKSTSRADSVGKAALSNDGAPSSKAGSTPQKSTANRHSRDPSPQRVTSSHPTHPDPHPSHARDQSRDHNREYDRDRGRDNRESHRRQQDDRESEHDQLRGRDYDKGGDFRRGRDYNMRRSSTSSSSRTSSASRERYRRRSRYNSSQRDSRSRYSSDRQRDGGNQRQDHRQSQSQSYKGGDRGRHQDRHYSDDQNRSSRQTRDRDSRSRYG